MGKKLHKFKVYIKILVSSDSSYDLLVLESILASQHTFWRFKEGRFTDEKAQPVDNHNST